MGMQHTVEFESGAVPGWDAIRAYCLERGVPLPTRMIDGALAFPDEVPPAEWRELRISTPAGMITVRRAGSALVFVTWGNADAGLLAAWNALTLAAAETGSGKILTDAGRFDPAAFRQWAELPAEFR